MATFPTGSDLQTFLISTGIVDNPPVAPMSSIDFNGKMEAVKKRLEDWTGYQPFEAAALDSTRTFNPWDIKDGTLDLRGGLAALTSLTISAAVQVLNTDFYLGPDHADVNGKPWTRIDLVSTQATAGGARRSIAITGKWGYCLATAVPEEVRNACLSFGAYLCAPQLALNISGGRAALTADDVKLQFGSPLAGEAAAWKRTFKSLHHYRRLSF